MPRQHGPVRRCLSSTADISSKLFGLPTQIVSVGLMFFPGAVSQYVSISLGAVGFLAELRQQHIARRNQREQLRHIGRALEQKNEQRRINHQSPLQPEPRVGCWDNFYLGHYGIVPNTISRTVMALTCLLQLASTAMLLTYSAISERETSFRNAGIILALIQIGLHTLDDKIKQYNIGQEAVHLGTAFERAHR